VSNDQMREFLKSNPTFARSFADGFHVTLVCDEEKLTDVCKNLFEKMTKDGTLTWLDWKTFLLQTRRMPEDFLQEAARQKRNAVQKI